MDINSFNNSLKPSKSSSKGAKFKPNALMSRKPPMNPYTFTELKDLEKDKNNNDILYDFTRLELNSRSNLGRNTGSSKGFIQENSKENTKYRDFKPKFTTASHISLSTKSSFQEEKKPNIQNTTTNTIKNTNKFMTNKLKIQGEELQNLMDKLEAMKKNGEPGKYNQELDEEKDYQKQFYDLKDKYEKNDRNYDLMRKLRKMYGKMYTSNADKALAYVKSGRMMDKRDMVYAMEKIYKQNMKKFNKKGSQGNYVQAIGQQPQMIIRKKNRPRSESSSSEESSSDENEQFYSEEKKLNLLDIEKKAEEIVKMKLQQTLPKEKSDPNFRSGNQYNQDIIDNFGEQEEKVVKLPNGMTLIKPDNPNDPPIILMPEEDTKSTKFSSVYSRDSYKNNLMNEYMDNMMTLKMMQRMQENESRGGTSRREKMYQIGEEDKRSKKKKKKRRRAGRMMSFGLPKPPGNSGVTTVKSGILTSLFTLFKK